MFWRRANKKEKNMRKMITFQDTESNFYDSVLEKAVKKLKFKGKSEAARELILVAATQLKVITEAEYKKEKKVLHVDR